MMASPNEQAQIEALTQLLFKLGQIADDADRVAESQREAATGTLSMKRQTEHEQAAAFHRALATLARQTAEDVRQKYGAA